MERLMTVSSRRVVFATFLMYLVQLTLREPAIFADRNFRAINFRATSPFLRTIGFCAIMHG